MDRLCRHRFAISPRQGIVNSSSVDWLKYKPQINKLLNTINLFSQVVIPQRNFYLAKQLSIPMLSPIYNTNPFCPLKKFT